MTYLTQSYQIGPDHTPKAIFYLILTTTITSLLCALLNPLLVSLFSIPGPQEFLSLSWWGLNHFYLWQPLTYLFVQESGVWGVSFYFLVGLFFNMYLLWVMGARIVELFGAKSFLVLYFCCGIVAGGAGILLMKLTQSFGILAGTTPSILGLFVVWTMLSPDAELLLFFLFPIKAKWLLAAILGSIGLIQLSNLDLIHLSFYFTGAVTGYFYGLFGYGLASPFNWMHSFDSALSHLGKRLHWKFLQKPKQQKSNKIFDIHTGEVLLDDDQFMDEMLAKIARRGEKSLTWRERRRMLLISERKMKDKLK